MQHVLQVNIDEFQKSSFMWKLGGFAEDLVASRLLVSIVDMMLYFNRNHSIALAKYVDTFLRTGYC